jgi:restriction endonuclease S subunit
MLNRLKERDLGVIFDSPSGIDKLKDLVLSLAVSGKLTSNISFDDSVEDLIAKAGNYLKPFPEISEERFQIPSHWKWVPLASIAQHQLGKMLHSSKMKGTGRLYLRSVNIRQDGSVDLSDLKEMLLSEEEFVKYSVKVGDIFVNEGGDVGRSAIFSIETELELAFQNALHRLRPVSDINPRYIHIVLQQAKQQGVIAQMSAGVTIQHFSASAIRRFAVPLPPLKEQEEIVRKVDELIALCEKLFQGQNHRDELAFAARRSAVDAIVKAQTSSELDFAWNRIKNNWDVIAGTLESVDSLRKLIISLAAKGKLVENSDRFLLKPLTMELSQVCTVSWGNLSLTKSSYVENGNYLAVSAAGPDGRISFAEHKAFTPVLSAIGARCGTMFMPEEDFTAIKNTMTLRPKPELLENWYLLYVLMGSDLPKRGSAQPFMSKTDIEKFRIRVPSLEEQREIATRVGALLEFCSQLESQINRARILSQKFSHSVLAAST